MSPITLAALILDCAACAILLATITDMRAFARQLRREEEQRAQERKEREQ